MAQDIIVRNYCVYTKILYCSRCHYNQINLTWTNYVHSRSLFANIIDLAKIYVVSRMNKHIVLSSKSEASATTQKSTCNHKAIEKKWSNAFVIEMSVHMIYFISHRITIFTSYLHYILYTSVVTCNNVQVIIR